MPRLARPRSRFPPWSENGPPVRASWWRRPLVFPSEKESPDVEKILQGVQRFRETVFAQHRALFERLAHKQSPQALFITCADSRIDPNLVTQTEPGDLFILRNAGNIIPPYGAASGGEGATIEYAIDVLKLKHIII